MSPSGPAVRSEQGDIGVPRVSTSALRRSDATLTMLAGMAGLGLNLVTGVITARVLDTVGRGEVAAIVSWGVVVAWMASLGFEEAMTYHQARSSDDAPRILTTTVVVLLILGCVGAVVAQAFLPLAFAAQSDSTLRAARLFMLAVPFIMGAGGMYALLAGHQRFRALATARLAQPLLFALLLIFLYLTGRFDVVGVLIAFAASFALVFVVVFVALGLRLGLGSLSPPLVRSGLGYGLRLQGHSIGQMGTTRLDMLVLPAFVASSEIGLYAVAVSAGSVVVAVFGSLGQVVFPAAARAGVDRGLALTERLVRLVFASSSAAAVGLALLGPVVIGSLYGESFLGAVQPLRLLLPGLVALATASIVAGGLRAVNRPGSASVAQLLGLVVTVVGLTLTLRPMGIAGAAVTSSVAYGVVLVSSLYLLGRQPEFAIRRIVSPAALREDLRAVTGAGIPGLGRRRPERRSRDRERSPRSTDPPRESGHGDFEVPR